jgi:sigma-B regulation protein RsbQ
MDERLIKRHNITVSGDGPITLLFVHGLGASQNVWREMAPAFCSRYRVVKMDLLGCGDAARQADEPSRYDTLDGHAQDLVQVAGLFHPGRTLLVTHSVGAMIGLLADRKAPHLFDGHVMVTPSPCYLNLPGYAGGSELAQLHGMLAALAEDLPGWARTMSPVFVGESPPGPLAADLEQALCRADPAMLYQFARATFLSDMRAQLPMMVKPVAVLQCTSDDIAPPSVGRYMHRMLPDCSLYLIDSHGHFPQLRAPQQCIDATASFLNGLGLTMQPATIDETRASPLSRSANATG